MAPRLFDGRSAYDHHDDWLVELVNEQQKEIKTLQAERKELAAALVPKKCTRCKGTGSEWRNWNLDYIPCTACGGRGS